MIESAKKIRQDFIEGVTPFVKDYVAVARGEGVMPHLDKDARAAVWDVAKQIILEAGDQQKIKAKNTTQVLALLKAGKVSVAEAKDLMTMLDIKTDIEEAPRIREALEKLEGKP